MIAQPGHVQVNGSNNFDRQRFAERLVGEPLTQGYKPTLPLWALFTADTVPQFYLLRDVELMMIHPVCRSALDYYKGGIADVEFWGGPKLDDPDDEHGLPISGNPDVANFVLQQCYRFWDRGVPMLQGGYEYGWIAGEPLYVEENGRLVWDSLLQFSPRDVYLLTREGRPVGVRVKQIAHTQQEQAGNATSSGIADLWLASRDVPAKGVWYAHNPRYSQYFGQSQLLGAWKPWRRLAWKDGAEGNIDLGFYRFWCAGPVVYYPNEDFQTGVNAPAMATTVDSQGRPRRFARDFARQLAEWYKSGAGVGLPSDKYTQDFGSGDKWRLDLPQSTLNVEGGIVYARYLMDQIRYGVGVPPELMEASESGGGFNGRMVPMYGFLTQQQKIADAMLILFVKQILAPLVRWNFGDVPWTVQVKPLLKTRFENQKGKASPPANPMGAEPPGLPGPSAGPRGGERGVPAPPATGAPTLEAPMPNVGLSLEREAQLQAARLLAQKILLAGKAA
jgi:hypothetical protein